MRVECQATVPHCSACSASFCKPATIASSSKQPATAPRLPLAGQQTTAGACDALTDSSSTMSNALTVMNTAPSARPRRSVTASMTALSVTAASALQLVMRSPTVSSSTSATGASAARTASSWLKTRHVRHAVRPAPGALVPRPTASPAATDRCWSPTRRATPRHATSSAIRAVSFCSRAAVGVLCVRSGTSARTKL